MSKSINDTEQDYDYPAYTINSLKRYYSVFRSTKVKKGYTIIFIIAIYNRFIASHPHFIVIIIMAFRVELSHD